MSLKRVVVLLGKEFIQGPRSFIFVWAVVAPVVISLLVGLVFGTLFSEKPKLGLVDEGASRLVVMAKQLSSVTTREYQTVSELRSAAESGAVDIGIVLPKDFDSNVTQGQRTEISGFVWGESLARNRAILGVTIANLAREVAGQEAPVTIETVTLGDRVSIPWSDRILPLIVLMAVFVGGLFLPATSVISEKEKRTLEAIVITPTTVEDIFVAKGLLGLMLSLFMGIVILILNQAFGAQPGLLILVLALGAVLAVELGLLLGAVIKDITTLFAVWKLGAILLFAPALVYLFPQIPEWVGRLFPTYYIVQPIVEISQRGGSWPDIATDALILIGMNAVLIGIVGFTLKRTKQYAV